ncbi:RNA-dependent RNA polymerase [Betachrysovirus aspergilli]|uniref:RNA-directed RNA polymerase n=1 Tax=Betachrysovirus aspergilli TaxID=2164061 RepID=A0A3Q8ENL5_9VIRU|nr:RNA-dependent RNA polymerase [Betachrysovirus aspergilli]AWC67507.1 RNA-dependent RNA polymerase [Betachrysovirus aspergilli]
MNQPTLGASYSGTPTGSNATRLLADGANQHLPHWSGLKAIVAPACCGKSTLALRFGGYDVDDVVADGSTLELDSELDEMIGGREDGLFSGDGEAMHRQNLIMLQRARRFLSIVEPDDNPLVLYCHTAEFAEALGLPVLAVILVDEDAIKASSRLQQAPSSIRQATLRLFQDQSAANVEFARRHGLDVVRCRTYGGAAQRVRALLSRAGIISDGPHATEYYSMLDNSPKESELLDRCMALLRKDAGPQWLRACAARQLRLSLGDTAPTEAHRAHNHPSWAQVVHAIFSNARTNPVLTVPDLSEDEWRVKFPLGPGNASFALCNISDWVARSRPHIDMPEEYLWFKQLCSVAGVKYERALCFLTMGDVASYVVPQYKELLHRLPLGSLSDEAYAPLSKLIHNNVRVGLNYLGRRVPVSDLAYLTYFDCLAGRVIGTENIQTEIEDRTRLQEPKRFFANGAWSAAEFDQRFENAINAAYDHLSRGFWKTLQRLGSEVETFEKFLETRRQWVRPGSATGAPKADVWLQVPEGLKSQLDDVTVDVSGMTLAILRRVRLNKSALFEFPQFVELVREAVDEYLPNSVTGFFWKHEAGKPESRALFPAHLTHYIMVSHVLYLAEKGGEIPNSRLTAGSEAQQRDHWLWRESHDASVHLMLDYANFNETHSIEAMKSVMLGLKSVYARYGALSPDLQYAINWTAESFERILLSYDGQLIRLTHGLLSGWRCTTWINSVANVAYLRVIGEQVGVFTGRPVFLDFQSGGDDVAAESRSLYDAALALRVGAAMGFEFKAIKQLISYEHREFYRLFVNEEGVYGSLCRMLGSALSGQWSNSVLPKFVEPAAKLSSVIEIARKAGRRARNLSFMEKMALCAFDKWATDGEHQLVDYVIHGTKATGGLGIPNVYGDIYELDGGPVQQEGSLKPVNVPDAASRPLAKKMVAEVEALLGPSAVVDVGTLSQEMAAGGFFSSIAQSLGPRTLRVAGQRVSRKVVRRKAIREEEFHGNSSSFVAARHRWGQELAAMKRAGKRYSALAQAVKPERRRDLATMVCLEYPGSDPGLLQFWQEGLELYGCATYLLTEDYYEDVVLLALLIEGPDIDRVSRRAAELAVGLKNDGYMYY